MILLGAGGDFGPARSLIRTPRKNSVIRCLALFLNYLTDPAFTGRFDPNPMHLYAAAQ